MNMSPGWLNNRLEQFGGIGSMIGHWEEMERREEEEEEGRENHDSERGRRRSSKKMRELLEVFEEGGGGRRYDNNSQLDSGDRVLSSLSSHTSPHSK